MGKKIPLGQFIFRSADIVISKTMHPPIPIHMPQPSIFVIATHSSPSAAAPNNARVIENPSLPNKLWRERKVARFEAGTLGATAAFNGAVISALGHERSSVAIAAGILTKKCMIAIIATCKTAAERNVAPSPIFSRIRIDLEAINEATIIVSVR